MRKKQHGGAGDGRDYGSLYRNRLGSNSIVIVAKEKNHLQSPRDCRQAFENLLQANTPSENYYQGEEHQLLPIL